MAQEYWFSPHESNRRVGSIINVSATEALINLTKAGSSEQNWIMGTKLPIGEVNEFVFIDCGQTTILAKVIKVWLENGERLTVDQLSDITPSNNPIALIQLLVSVDVEKGSNHKGIQQYPKLGAQVYAAHPKLVSLLAEGIIDGTTLNLPIAEMPHDSSVTIGVTPEKLFARHCAILGSTGGGKSYTIANLIENVHGAGGKVLLLDATGEYSKLPCDSYYVGDHNNATPKNQVTYPHWMFTDSDIRALLRPSAQSQAPKLSEAIKSLKIIYQNNLFNFQDISINQNGNLEKTGKPKKGVEKALLQIAPVLEKSAWSFSHLGDQIIEECVWPNADYNKDITKWGDKHEGDIGHCLNLISRIKAMSSNTHLKWMIDCDSILKKIPDVLSEFIEEKDNGILRLDLSAIPFEANSRELLVNAIGRKLLEFARTNKITHDQPLLVFIDEAHQFLNKKIGDDQQGVFKLDAFGDIAKEGRKYGLNVVIATQRPRDIPEDVLSQIGTLIVHRLTNDKDQEIVKKAVGSIDHRSASFLPVLGQGEALLLGVDFPFPMTVKIKKPTNEPYSNSANFSKSWGSQKKENI